MSSVYPEAQSVLQKYDIALSHGLDSKTVQEHREKFGSNAIDLPDPEPWWKTLFDKFTDNPIPILIAAADIAMSLPLLQSDLSVGGGILLGATLLVTFGPYMANQIIDRVEKDEDRQEDLKGMLLNGQVIVLTLIAIVLAVTSGIAEATLTEFEFPLDGVAILVAVGLATGVGYINEYKSQIEYEKLKLNRLDIPVTVTRNGQEAKVSVQDVVVGDIIHLETGRKLPADCVLLHSESMYVDQSRMTGEAVPVYKNANDVELYGGTDVVAGTGAGIVVKVGNNSEWGKIARQLASEEQEKTPLEERLDNLTDFINLAGTIAAGLIFVALAIQFLIGGVPKANGGVDWIVIVDEAISWFIIAVTIIVVAVPEGLPMAVNVSLALSMAKIAEDNNLVRKLAATETIGSSTVILSDKTGTLTKNQMTVSEIFLTGERITGNSIQNLKEHPSFTLLQLSTAVNSTAHLIDKDGQTVPDGNSTEGALLVWCVEQDTDYRELREHTDLLMRLPFNAEKKRMSSVVQSNGQTLALVKGAPERVIPLCNSIEMKTGLESIDNHLTTIQAELEYQTKQAMRTLALAYRTFPDSQYSEENIEGDLIFLALIGIIDPMREDVPEAIRITREAGIDVKMVTGDNVKTAEVLAGQLGMLDGDSIVMEGDDFRSQLTLEEKSPGEFIVKDVQAELLEKIPNLRVLARAQPMDKFALVDILKKQRQVVAVTGDGTNDAPALKHADVGLSMGLSGTEVAKEASDIVLLDDNFYSIVRAVHWGRTLYENIQKFLQFQLTINLSALAIAFLSPLLTAFGVPLPEVPLTVIHLLWINLIMDTLAVLALTLEPPSDDTMKRKPIGRTEPVITKTMMQNIIGMGGYFTIALLILMATGFFGILEPGGWLNNQIELLALQDGIRSHVDYLMINDNAAIEYIQNHLSSDQGTDIYVEGARFLLFSSMIFTTYVFFQVFNLFNARSLHLTKSPFAGLGKSRNFLLVMVVIILVQVALTFLGGQIFRTIAIPLNVWGLIVVITSTALIFGELVRRFRLSRIK